MNTKMAYRLILLIAITIGLLPYQNELAAQYFTEVNGTPFTDVAFSSVDFADIDGDNDQDVLITGRIGQVILAQLFTNDGSGNFTEKTGASFQSLEHADVAFADIDGDNDLDVLITGFVLSNSFTKLYTNDGLGNFIEVLGTSFVYGEIAFSDIDGDNDQDLLILGDTTKLYTNDGSGTFTEKTQNILPLSSGSVAFADVDGDNDQDVFTTGVVNQFPGPLVSQLYVNDGLGNFTISQTCCGFPGFKYSAIAFEDVDGDSDQDLLLTGMQDPLNGPTTSELWLNDGLGGFTKAQGTPFIAVSNSAIGFSDIDRDNDPDLLITGEDYNNNYPSTKLYTNDGTGTFTEISHSLELVAFGALAFADVNGDQKEDLILSGPTPDSVITKLFFNSFMVPVDEVSKKTFSMVPTLYPNPSTADKINIQYHSNTNNSVLVTIFDLKGSQLIQKQEQIEIGEGTFSVNISSLSKGSYILQLDDGTSKWNQKLLVH